MSLALAKSEPTQRSHGAGNLAWLDLEMTGLDPERDVILQAALIVTTPSLDVLEEFVCDIWQPDESLAIMTPYVRDMHLKTGLIERVQRSKVDLGSAEKRLLERVAGYCPFPAVLCGNTIGQDKRFVDRYMPGLAGYLSYRTIDVSSVKLLAKAWYGDTAMFAKPKDGAHDALFDVRNSIAELAHYKKTLFR
jgi:oligoribonuclease